MMYYGCGYGGMFMWIIFLDRYWIADLFLCSVSENQGTDADRE